MLPLRSFLCVFFFFFNDTATTEIYTLSLHDALPIYPWGQERLAKEQARDYLEWIPLLRDFTGTHPAIARDWIAERNHDPERVVGPAHFKPQHIRFYISDLIERLTGARVFEFRNYEVV